MVGLLAILFTVFGALFYSYFYIRLYSEQWPQAGLPSAGLTSPLIAFGLLTAGGLTQVFSSWQWRRNNRLWLSLGISATALLGLGFIAVELTVLLNTPFQPTANAYASIFFTINSFVLLLTLTGIALQAGTLIRVLRLGEPLDTARLRLWLQNTELFWFFTVAVGLAGFLIAYLSPHIF